MNYYQVSIGMAPFPHDPFQSGWTPQTGTIISFVPGNALATSTANVIVLYDDGTFHEVELRRLRVIQPEEPK